MKRVGHLYDEIISDTNLIKAIALVNESHRWIHNHKPNKTVLWVDLTIADRVKDLRRIIEEGYEPSPSTKKCRYDVNARKWRDIYEPKLWPDQYIQHALIQVLEPIFMRDMDYWCCGSIPKRGAHHGIKGIKKWMVNDPKGTRWCVELDIKHFYDSLPPDVVMKRMRCLIKDYRTLDLIWRVIRNGIQIGSYSSQWFANTTLQPLDHILRDQCKVSHYIRYMDNFTIFCRTKKEADGVIGTVRCWLNENGMDLKDNWQKFKIRSKMPCNGKKRRYPNALGYRFGRGFTLLRKHNLLRLRRYVRSYNRKYESGKRISLKFAQGLLSRFGMLRHCNSTSIYKEFKPKTQKHLKDVVRANKRKETLTWSMCLELNKDLAKKSKC